MTMKVLMMRAGLWTKAIVLALGFIAAAGGAARAAAAAADEPGTIGLGFAQLYNADEPSKRGVLVARRVEPGFPAADAGVQVGDLIIAINGTPVTGRDAGEIARKDFRGPAGGTVRLAIIKLDGSQSEITLTRKPFPPHVNPASDAFGYVVPGNWRLDPRYPFPLPWAPAVSHQGFEDVAFGPDFGDTTSPDYHSYLFFWWVDGTTPLTAAEVQRDMLAYFRGLAEDRGPRFHFTPDLSKVSAEYHDAAAGPQTFGGLKASAFAGVVTLYDTHGKVITLQSEVVSTICTAAGHRAIFFAMSQQPRPADFWTQLDHVRDSFRCSR